MQLWTRHPAKTPQESTNASSLLADNHVNGESQSDTGSGIALHPRLKWIWAAVLIIGGLLTAYGWAAASPSGSSPDDDFHQASIWCPTPWEAHCPTTALADGTPAAEMPVSVVHASICYAFKPDESAACVLHLSDDEQTWVTHLDNGLYPGGYYDVMHLFVGHDVYRSLILMRMVNATVAILLLGAVGILLPGKDRRLVAMAWLAVCVPLALYLLSSVNPSGWATAGVMVAWAGMHGLWLQIAESSIRTWRTGGLVAVTLLGAIAAAISRSDAGAYLGLAALSVTLLHGRIVLRHLWGLAVPAIISVIGVVGFFSGSQSQALETGLGPASGDAKGIFAYNVLHLPQLLVDYTASMFGLNWADTPMPPLVWAPVLLVSLGLVFWGLQRMDIWKALACGVLFCAIVFLPMWTLQQGLNLVGSAVQPRYLLPLIPITLATLLIQPKTGGMPRLSTAQLIVSYLMLVGAQAVGLHTQIRRFVRGLDATSWNLNDRAEWWHPGPSPMATWAMGSLGFALLCSLIFIGSKRRPESCNANDPEVEMNNDNNSKSAQPSST